MANDNGFLIDASTVQRIAKAVREFERGVKKPGMVESYSDPLSDGESYIEIISTTTTAGRYNAIEKVVRPDTGGWQYSNVQCYAEEINAGALTVGSTYKGTIKTSAIDAGTVKNVFSVQASGGSGGAPLVIDVVTDISCVSGVLTVTKRKLTIPGGTVV
jgi:hypothetical protein